MEAIAKESAKAINISPRIYYIAHSRREMLNPRILMDSLIKPEWNDSLFLGYETYLRAKKIGRVFPQSCNLYFTHPNQVPRDHDLNLFSKILVMNQSHKELLINFGANSERIQIVYGALDKSIYCPNSIEVANNLESRNPYVLISSDFKPRKNPELILKVIQAMPHLDFIIHGRGWKKFLTSSDLNLNNLKFMKFNLEIQPQLMRNAHAFLSLSTNEGGPYPLIEALASGTPAVVTRTGFADDFINHKNGALVETGLHLLGICQLLDEVVKKKSSLFGLDLTFKDLSWSKLGESLYSR
jgi:glycosyltransferase involved in cell wall biosynthesis